MPKHRQHRYESLDDKLLYPVHHLVALLLAVIVIVNDVVENRGKCALMALIGIIDALVELKLSLILRVDGVVGEMHEHVLEVVLVRLLVGICRETCHALAEEINLQRFDREEEHVKPAVEFKVIDEHGLLDVFLDHVVVV